MVLHIQRLLQSTSSKITVKEQFLTNMFSVPGGAFLSGAYPYPSSMSNYDSEAARAAWAAAAHIPATALQASSLGKQFIISILMFISQSPFNQLN